MPTYTYECRKCGLYFDKFQKMSDAPLEKCPECGGAAQRLIGTGGVGGQEKWTVHGLQYL